MKELFKEAFSTPAHLGVVWMIITIALFLLTMLVDFHVVPTWLWLILMIPGFAMVIGERDPGNEFGDFGLWLYDKLNFFGSDWAPEPATQEEEEGGDGESDDTTEEEVMEEREEGESDDTEENEQDEQDKNKE
jgi:hypothetical protein